MRTVIALVCCCLCRKVYCTAQGRNGPRNYCGDSAGSYMFLLLWKLLICTIKMIASLRRANTHTNTHAYIHKNIKVKKYYLYVHSYIYIFLLIIPLMMARSVAISPTAPADITSIPQIRRTIV